jgi:glycosyltransferase involved in cell wall biosynthesis
MKVGIYNRWLHTIGGGEKHMGVMAEILSKEHSVDLLTYQPVDKEKLQSRLNVDLNNVKIKYLPEVSNGYTLIFTEQYDLFINASYMSSLPSKAKRSLLLVFFPTPFDRELTITQKAAIRVFGPLVKRILSNDVKWLDGFYQQERFHGVPYRWAGKEARLWIPKLEKNLSKLQICLGSYRKSNFPEAEVQFYVDGVCVNKELKLPRDRFIKHVIQLPPDLDVKDGVVLEIQSNTFVPAQASDSQDTRELGVSVVWVCWNRSPSFYLRRLANLTPTYLKIFPKTLDFLETYDLIMANSKYTQEWIKKLWNKESLILYPPIDTHEFSPGSKSNIILSVGRFFKGSHNKKQVDMIRAFKKMCDNGLQGWEYHLVGGTHKEPKHQKYLEEVIRESKDYPIFVHPDSSFEELKELYAQSKIYWHASGFGEDGQKSPERFEHFGITTVEAMSAGCVPVVIGKAGQIEIVESGKNGFLWNSLEELQSYTFQLIQDENLRKKLSEKAIERSNIYSREKFEERLSRIL